MLLAQRLSLLSSMLRQAQGFEVVSQLLLKL